MRGGCRRCCCKCKTILGHGAARCRDADSAARPGANCNNKLCTAVRTDRGGSPAKVTAVAPQRFVPVIVTEVPAAPEVGVKEVIVGA